MKLRLFPILCAASLIALASCRMDKLTGPANNTTSSDTIAYWTFDGNTKDVSGNGHDGIAFGTPDYYAGNRFGGASSGTAIDLNSTSWVSVPDKADLDFTAKDSYTISAWVNLSGKVGSNYLAGGVSNIVDKMPTPNMQAKIQTGYGIFADSGRFSAQIIDDGLITLQSNSPVRFGTWHMVTLVVAAHESATLFLDSSAVDSRADTLIQTIVSNNVPILMGAVPGNSQSDSTSLDDILIVHHAMSGSEIAARFHEGGWYEHSDTVVKPPPPPPPPNGTLVTGNKFVAAQVVAPTGLITFISAGGTGATTVPPGTRLSYVDKSFLSIKSGLTSSTDTFYTNNNLSSQNICDPIGSAIGQALIQYNLTSGSSTKNADTIETVWVSQGPSVLVDIVQDVYPVEFESSGQIVVSVKIVNHYGVSQTFQAQYLNDGMLSNSSSVQDNVFIVNSLGVVGTQWQLYEAPNVPTYFAAFFDDPRIAGPLSADTAAIGFLSDAYAPAPMGLISPSAVYHCQWSDAVGYTFGLSNRTGLTFDMATLLQWPSVSVPAGSSMEIMRTSYGTNQMPLSQMPIH